ncbi:cupin domain-containing protein [Streptomyces sp. NPDC100445]|uniref:cupin domain-containing protein n=1 Tax=Streptomyces sp. NPDC100445 TaxID=3366102 RepID=UPI00381E4197
MTILDKNEDVPRLVRADQTERVGGGELPWAVELLLDADRSGGRLSCQRSILAPGADGAPPHRHAKCAEWFYLISGRALFLAEDQVIEAGPGDSVYIPPGSVHAFKAVEGKEADLVGVFAPAVNRFGYYRLMADFRAGRVPHSELEAAQERYDNFFATSAVWDARTSAG